MRGSLERAGISGWFWTLFVVCLCIVMWELPLFGASGEACGCRHYDVPRARHGTDLELAPRLIVSPGGARELDGVPVDDEEALVRELEQARRSWSILHPREPFPESLLLIADRSTRWGTLRPLLIAAARVGYTRPQLVVEVDDFGGDTIDWERFGGADDLSPTW